MRYWLRLSAVPVRLDVVAEFFGRSRKQAARMLHKLAKAELAEQRPDGWVRGEASLDDLAEAWRVADLAVRKRDHYHRDRKQFREWIEAYWADRRVRAMAPFEPGHRYMDVDAQTGEIVTTSGPRRVPPFHGQAVDVQE